MAQKIIQHPLQRAPVMVQHTAAVTGTTHGVRRMPIASNTNNGLGGSNMPTGVPTASVNSTPNRR